MTYHDKTEIVSSKIAYEENMMLKNELNTLKTVNLICALLNYLFGIDFIHKN